MAAPRTTIPLHVRSYEVRPDARAGNLAFLNWFEEASLANSVELGFDIERFRSLGFVWVMRSSDLEICERPFFNERIMITTWIADLKRVQAYHQYEARRSDGTLLARCSTLWILLDIKILRPVRIPKMMRIFEPAKDFVMPEIKWPKVEGQSFTSQRQVAFFEEDQLQHVNNANYLNWIEENARQAFKELGRPNPNFQRHFFNYRLPAVLDDVVTIKSTFAPYGNQLAWKHEITRNDTLLVRANSLSEK